jgi:hypothetical protein
MQEVRNAYSIGIEDLKKTDHFREPCVAIRIKIYLIKIGYEAVDCVHVAQDREKWRLV